MPGRRRSSRNADPLAHLKKDGPKPVYIVHGEARLLVDEAVEEIKKYALPKTAVDFNYDVFIGKDVNATKIADAARMLPAFAPQRMVIVKDADKLNADTQNGLLPYLKDPSPTTVLVFIGAKVDARTKFYKAAQKAGATIKLSHPTSRQMPSIVKARAKRMNVALEPEAVRAIVDAIGTDVGAVVAALEKLSLYIGPEENRAVTAVDVENVVSHVKEESIFLLSDAIGSRDTSGALQLLHGMLSASRGHPLALLGLIAGHWRRLTVTRALMDDRAPRRDIEAALGMPPFVIDKLLRQAQRQTTEGLVQGLRAIAAADQAMKGGQLPANRVMERLVLRLT